MHSSEVLQSERFAITVDGEAVAHGAYFAGWTRRDRLAVYCPRRIEMIGAINLVMAHVTAFYNDYRASGEPFFAYPDYFALYREGQARPAYHMLDIYPDHKAVAVAPGRLAAMAAVTDRAANVLLVPDTPGAQPWLAGDSDRERLAFASAQRTITTCYAYAPDGNTPGADITITCDAKPLVEWARPLVDAITDDDEAARRGRAWLASQAQRDTLTESYRRIGLAEALGRLAPVTAR